MEDMQKFGRLIKSRRDALGLRLEDVAAKINRPFSFVWRLEQGNNANTPDPQVLRDLAAALAVSERDMLTTLGYMSDVPETEQRDAPAQHLHAVVDQHTWNWSEALWIGDVIQSYWKRMEDANNTMTARPIPLTFRERDDDDKAE